MTRHLKLFSALAFLFLAAGIAPAAENAQPQKIPSGEKLVQEKCEGCHHEEVYTSKTRKVQSIGQLKSQVESCARASKAGFTEKQLEKVVSYLNRTYYKF